MPTTLNCSRCGELTTWEDNQYRPFCSERCKLIDFGAWANEGYKLPTQDAPQADGGREEDQY
ncbi:MAG: DNA gyrase inhibitor YacG [Acinetobacter sp.]|uniref:DNA gyrase inhibitor YacG n=1 Tax=Acinetobacter faecalis TaxID=2665161 RepID=UPI001B5F448F|nr:DNA gyrase inhibitor YacG [Acinetobacter faecalis]MBP7782822.1 DNA gyrase inhibitor YacG [Acinetobacter sp.]MBP7793397.1 DNA gyrase inhibitor YacG [Acinetobacter sp.]MDY6468170.1 DNA gyrase inhibitor YacG [Acinetobacter faecalis]